jgi:AAA+ superfamily predicted ATPase
MSQYDFIRDITRYGLENDREKLLSAVNDLIEYSKKGKKVNFALQLQSIIKDSFQNQKISTLRKVNDESYGTKFSDEDVRELILEKLTSDYTFNNLVCGAEVENNLRLFVKEQLSVEMLQRFDLPVANKLLLYGPSGCGKTLASYVIAGELKKLMIVVNLGSIVSSKLGETSKNLAKLFRKAASEECIIFIDEFDSLGKVRDYSQDHGEMKRVVNTILQLFDYLPQNSLIIAATNQKEMLDPAVVRRFDLSVKLDLPDIKQISHLISLTLKDGIFKFDKPAQAKKVMKTTLGLSYYSIQKTLVTAIKRSILENSDNVRELAPTIQTSLWQELILQEKTSLNVLE